MNKKILGGLAGAGLLLALAGVAAYKQLPAPSTEPLAVAKPAASPEATAPLRSTVLVVVDPHEAGETHGCGEIIHLAKQAKKHGLSVVELAPESKSSLMQQYQIKVEPTVLIIDAQGQVATRREGEDADTIQKIRGDLEALTKTKL